MHYPLIDAAECRGGAVLVTAALGLPRRCAFGLALRRQPGRASPAGSDEQDGVDRAKLAVKWDDRLLVFEECDLSSHVMRIRTIHPQIDPPCGCISQIEDTA